MTDIPIPKQKYSLYHTEGRDESFKTWEAPYADVFRGCKKVLDIGCGPGFFLELLAERGIPAEGIDYDPEMVKYCGHRGLNAITADARTLKALDGPYDGIHAGHVIEHMAGEEAIKFLEECTRILKDGGLFIIRTPNWENQTVREGGFWLDHTHVRPYPLPLLHRIFLDMGFDIAGSGAEKGGWNDLYIIGRKKGCATTRIPANETGTCSSTQIGVTWEGSFLVNHSLANANREIVLSLSESKDIDLSLTPYELNQFTDTEEARFAKITSLSYRQLPHTDFHVRHFWPPNWAPPANGEYILMQPWEFGSLPCEWKEGLRNVREVWSYSNYVKDLYLRAGCPEDMVHVIPLGINPEQFNPVGDQINLDTKKSFRFLYVGGLIGRKGVDILLNAYLNEFKQEEDVCLVIKDFYYQSPLVSQVEELAKRTDIPEILHLHGSISPANLPRLYRSCQCYVHPYRGEGFGLPILEAMACALPVITTNYGPALDYCHPSYTYLIPAQLVPSEEARVDHLATIDKIFFAEPDMEILRKMMRRIYNNYRQAKEQALIMSQFILQNRTWQNTAKQILERLAILKAAPLHPRIWNPQTPIDTILEAHNNLLPLQKAEALLNLGEVQTALAILEKLSYDNPPLPGIQILLAEALFALKESKSAREILHLSMHSIEALPSSLLFTALRLALDLKEETLFKQLLSLSAKRSSSALDLLFLCNILEKYGQLEGAIKIYNKLADNNMAEAHYRLGRLKFTSGDFEKARELLERATDLFPGHTFAWQMLSQCARSLNDNVSEQASQMQLAKLDPYFSKSAVKT